MKIQPTMTPERLAECTHELWVGCPTYCANCRTELSDYLAAQRAHIRDLEAQVREALDSPCEGAEDWDDEYVYGWEAAIGCIRKKLSTATPPSPEVK